MTMRLFVTDGERKYERRPEAMTSGDWRTFAPGDVIYEFSADAPADAIAYVVTFRVPQMDALYVVRASHFDLPSNAQTPVGYEPAA